MALLKFRSRKPGRKGVKEVCEHDRSPAADKEQGQAVHRAGLQDLSPRSFDVPKMVQRIQTFIVSLSAAPNSFGVRWPFGSGWWVRPAGAAARMVRSRVTPSPWLSSILGTICQADIGTEPAEAFDVPRMQTPFVVGGVLWVVRSFAVNGASALRAGFANTVPSQHEQLFFSVEVLLTHAEETLAWAAGAVCLCGRHVRFDESADV